EKAKVVILGGGMVAGYAAKQLVELGHPAGDLTIISADHEVPYERPPLSKGFLAGKDTLESIRINPPEFYTRHGIDLRLGVEVERVEAGEKQARMKRAAGWGYEKLVVATGAHPRTLNVTGARLNGIHSLRSMDVSRRIREHAGSAKRAAVI